MTTLENKDYLSILSFYNLKTPKTAGKIDYKKVEEMAERKLADKLCRCIKKVHKSRKKKNEGESRAVAICSSSVVKRKGLKYTGFKCKKQPRFLSKTKKHRLYKVKGKEKGKGKGKRRIKRTRKRNKR